MQLELKYHSKWNRSSDKKKVRLYAGTIFFFYCQDLSEWIEASCPFRGLYGHELFSVHIYMDQSAGL